ncbi:hypothetical protein LT493_02580 [Streptomyces tricolor]|nr:hypothetical protein [Streptomyces tricolor]
MLIPGRPRRRPPRLAAHRQVGGGRVATGPKTHRAHRAHRGRQEMSR